MAVHVKKVIKFNVKQEKLAIPFSFQKAAGTKHNRLLRNNAECEIKKESKHMVGKK